jgi:hypothetical protein
MKDNKKELLFIKDLVYIIREMAENAKKDKNDQFEIGRHTAFYEILSIIEQQVIVFGYNKVDIGIKNFSSDKDIL